LLVIYLLSDFAELLATAFFPLLFLGGLLRLSGISMRSARPERRPIRRRLFSSLALCGRFGFRMRRLAFWPVTVWRCFFSLGCGDPENEFNLRSWGQAASPLGLGLAAFYIVRQRRTTMGEYFGSARCGLTPNENFLFAVTQDSEHDAFNRIASYIANC